MVEYLYVILEALLDTAKVLPLLFIVYYLIELIEYKCAFNFVNNNWLKGKAAPIIASGIGCIPQCGFSVVSTDLYSRGAISVGALVAVYIATSDEAIPLMIANPSSFPFLIALIAAKLILGIVVGYLANLLYKLIFKKKKVNIEQDNNEEEHDHDNHAEHEHDENDEKHLDLGCCHHGVNAKSFNWWHPLLHCLKISAFILVINILFNCITHIWIGEAALTNFLSASIYLQPLLSVLIGLIPNCASSVVLTELFLIGGLSFGALLAGLCMNAGLGLIFLFKQNKNWKENLFIVMVMLSSSLIVGYALNFI